MRTMHDAVTPSNIPANAEMVAGYIDGRYAWKASDWDRFPHAVKVRIAVFASTNDGHVLDVEAGDATPAQAAGWLTMRRRAGVDPSIYCSLSVYPAVVKAILASRVPEPHYWIAAHPGNGANLYPPPCVAHQYADVDNLYDLSAVADYWPGVDPIILITDPEVPPMPRNALPAAALPLKGHSAVWKPDSSQIDVFMHGADGHLYHDWWVVSAGSWNGPEVVDAAG